MNLARPTECDWRESAYYQRLLPADRRHWAWFWARRSLEYQSATSVIEEMIAGQMPLSVVKATTESASDAPFPAGYLCIMTVHARTITMPGSSGDRLAIHRLWSWTPNRYPIRIERLSISRGFPTLPVSSLMPPDKKPSFWLTAADRFNSKSGRVPCCQGRYACIIAWPALMQSTKSFGPCSA